MVILHAPKMTGDLKVVLKYSVKSPNDTKVEMGMYIRDYGDSIDITRCKSCGLSDVTYSPCSLCSTLSEVNTEYDLNILGSSLILFKPLGYRIGYTYSSRYVQSRSIYMSILVKSKL